MKYGHGPNRGEKMARSEFRCKVARKRIELEVNKHGWAGWQGNKIS